MNIPEKLKLNRFKVVNLPSNKDLFSRFGKKSMPENLYTGDDMAPQASRKIDQIADYDAYDRMMQQEELNKQNGSEEDS